MTRESGLAKAGERRISEMKSFRVAQALGMQKHSTAIFLILLYRT
jgi:hypothetical protein